MLHRTENFILGERQAKCVASIKLEKEARSMLVASTSMLASKMMNVPPCDRQKYLRACPHRLWDGSGRVGELLLQGK